jgi:hypothetical protein
MKQGFGRKEETRATLKGTFLTLALREEGVSGIFGHGSSLCERKNRAGLDSEEINNRTSWGLHDPEANI